MGVRGDVSGGVAPGYSSLAPAGLSVWPKSTLDPFVAILARW